MKNKISLRLVDEWSIYLNKNDNISFIMPITYLTFGVMTMT